ncbi:ornithine cyclodeaminase family protein [Anaerolineae bacterium CFX7]|nr:ornithine cyclodeaminase family protein [Anaerolineae bacterium CFX7]RIK25618.1 MAG: peptide transporter [Chloroflexota bacterium]
MTQILYLSRADVERVGVTMREIIDAVETGFREHGEGRVEMPPKPGIHTMPDSFIHAMPAYIPALRAAGVKWVSGYPENQKRGLPYITGLLILNDTETGIPLAVMDCTWITAMRTGAATAVAAKYLARAESSSVGILGCGVQGTSNLQALAEQFSLRRVAVFDAVTAQAERLANFARENFGLETVIAKTARDAVDGVDLAVTAGPLLHTPHATIQKDWLNAGAFASLVDFDSYWHPDALKQADKFCTDDVPQYEHYRALGYFQNMPPIYATVGELVAGKKRGRENANEITMTCNLGLAIDDMATAPLVYARARERGIGVWLEL